MIRRSRERAPSPAAKNFRSKVKHAQLLLISSSKVAEENKIGEPPHGWFRDVALALQSGIAHEHHSSSSSTSGQPAKKDFQAAKPELFARVRAACGIPPARYAATMGLQEGQTDPSLRLVGSSDASGKSGAFFLLSPDQQCIAKSCTSEDWNTLLRILPSYVERVEAARASASTHRFSTDVNTEKSTSSSCAGFLETLLPRYLGMYTLKGVAEGRDEIRVLVMANVFSGSRTIHRRYDLKGSTVGRLASAKELAKASPVLKDKDWVRAEAVLALADNTRTRVISALEEDVRCLQEWGLMDYSLLLGIHDFTDAEQPRYEAMNVVYIIDRRVDKPRLCYIGIVDILTPYGWRKWTETLVRGRLQCGSDISCQHPRYYGDRFLRFMRESVFTGVE